MLSLMPARLILYRRPWTTLYRGPFRRLGISPQWPLRRFMCFVSLRVWNVGPCPFMNPNWKSSMTSRLFTSSYRRVLLHPFGYLANRYVWSVPCSFFSRFALLVDHGNYRLVPFKWKCLCFIVVLVMFWMPRMPSRRKFFSIWFVILSFLGAFLAFYSEFISGGIL